MNWDRNKKVAESIFECIGLTPMLHLKKISERVNAEIYGKLEFFSPTGSLKDRIYYRMIKSAIEKGELKKGMKIIEASTGNAGISCAFVGSCLGFEVIIVMPSGMSDERKKLMTAYGAKIIETPGGESDVDLCLEKIKEIISEDSEKYWQPGQFSNDENINAHYSTTAPEIWEQLCGDIDVFVASQGTGGTVSGVGKFLKEKNKNIKVFAVEPSEAPLLSKRKWGSHKIEGIGDGFVPMNLKLEYIDGIVTITSEEAIEMAKILAKEEGIFCGISSGCNVCASIKLSEKFPDMKNIVTMINDTGQRYFSTELCDVKKSIEIPKREHPMDKYTKEELDKYQNKWIIIE